MSLEADIAMFTEKLNAAIEDTLRNEVADAAKAEISRQLSSYEFPYSRAHDGIPNGLTDPEQFFVYPVEVVSGQFVLTIEDIALPQEKSAAPGQLAEAVTKGDKRWKMPGPRPFMKPAEEKMGGGSFENALSAGLRARGFTVL